MKNKVGIYTIQSLNYGNRLQNYAVQEYIKLIGFHPVSFRTKKINRPRVIYNKIKWVIRNSIKKDKFSNFCKFDSNIELSDLFIAKEEFSDNIRSNFDALIVGSDQVWNTTFDFVSVNSFLPFPHPNKIAFSASFGVDSIPYDQKIVDCLKDFKALSVREEAGAKIIKELTGREATVLVDPTMLLTVDEWRKVEKKPSGIKESKKTEKPKEGYILTYFLSPKCEEAKKRLEEIKGNRKVYELLNPEDAVAGKAGPSEFLWLFDHADLIITDSFHACVFSFLFDKPFIVYDRTDDVVCMNSRLETLLSKFHLERKYANSGLQNDIWEHDYEEGYKQLELEREKAMNFLKEALGDSQQ